MSTDAQLTNLASGRVILAGRGDKAHIEHPASVLQLLQPYLHGWD